MEKLKRAIQNALAKSSLHFTLKKEQMECISSVVTDGKDILAVLPTGYGKSHIYQLLPDVFDQYLVVQDSIVLVISPLNALMYDQIAKLNERGIRACMIQGHEVVVANGDQVTRLRMDELSNPTFQLIYMHPEICVHEKKFIGFMNSTVYQERVRCVIVDEAHLVLNWYGR